MAKFHLSQKPAQLLVVIVSFSVTPLFAQVPETKFIIYPTLSTYDQETNNVVDFSNQSEVFYPHSGGIYLNDNLTALLIPDDIIGVYVKLDSVASSFVFTTEDSQFTLHPFYRIPEDHPQALQFNRFQIANVDNNDTRVVNGTTYSRVINGETLLYFNWAQTEVRVGVNFPYAPYMPDPIVLSVLYVLPGDEAVVTLAPVLAAATSQQLGLTDPDEQDYDSERTFEDATDDYDDAIIDNINTPLSTWQQQLNLDTIPDQYPRDFGFSIPMPNNTIYTVDFSPYLFSDAANSAIDQGSSYNYLGPAIKMYYFPKAIRALLLLMITYSFFTKILSHLVT